VSLPVEVEGVSVRLGDVDALDDVSCSIETGTFVGLVGPNGAGKTTLLRTVAATLAPDAGTVRIGGEDVHALSSKAASRLVATVPQDTSVSFDFDVRDVVAMGRNPHLSRFGGPDAGDRDAVERALERTETAGFADRSINEVSGGERQRVLLARALAQDAPVLLLDEPIASLDVHHQVRTLELVADLVAEGRTVVAAIHDLNLAAHYCDELLLLSEGGVVADGRPADVLTADHLEDTFGTRAVVSSHPVTGSVYVTALPEQRGGERDAHVHVVGGGGSAARLLYVLSAAGFEVSTGPLNEGDSDLESARLLGVETVVEEPFAPVSERARREATELVRDADCTVLADVEVGPANLPCLEIAREAGRLVVVEERAFADRNYAGTRAAHHYEELRRRATITAPEDLLGGVTAALETTGRAVGVSAESADE
jgi:iron complex transport system ATP-binding protein